METLYDFWRRKFSKGEAPSIIYAGGRHLILCAGERGHWQIDAQRPDDLVPHETTCKTWAGGCPNSV